MSSSERDPNDLEESLMPGGDGAEPAAGGEIPVKAPSRCNAVTLLWVLGGAAITIPYTGPAAFALIVRGWSYFHKDGDDEILRVIPTVLDDISASYFKIAVLSIYSFATAVFMAIFHLYNIKKKIAGMIKIGCDKSRVAALVHLLSWLALAIVCLPTGGLAIANSLSGLLFLSYAFKTNLPQGLVAFSLWMTYLITALGNGAWSHAKISGLHGCRTRVDEARENKNCRVSCNKRFSGFMGVVGLATVISYAFFNVYNEEGCQVVFPVFHQLRMRDYDLGFKNFTNTTLEQIDEEMNGGDVGFNSTVADGALAAVCVMNGLYYATRYITMVAMRIALPLVLLDWAQGGKDLCWQAASILFLAVAAVGLLGFPSAGQVVDVQDAVTFKFLFDLVCFLLGSTSNNVVKVMGEPREKVESCLRSIFCGPQRGVRRGDEDEEGLSLLRLADPPAGRERAPSL
jgi:hypothetical protein